jgi:hypothetical protein
MLGTTPLVANPPAAGAWKYSGTEMIECLTLLFNISWNHSVHPKQWDNAFITPLFKGGPDPHDVNKYRAITLLSTSGKVYEAVLLR